MQEPLLSPNHHADQFCICLLDDLLLNYFRYFLPNIDLCCNLLTIQDTVNQSCVFKLPFKRVPLGVALAIVSV